MATWILTVSSTYLATVEEVWADKTDLAALEAEFRPFLRMTVDDPARLQAALRGAAPAEVAGRLSGPFGVLTIGWPMRVERSEPPVRYVDSSVNRLLSRFEHEHRVEDVGAGRVRYVDRVVFTPRLRPSGIGARLTRALFLHRHARAARRLRRDEVEGTRAVLRRLTEPVAHPVVGAAPA